MNRGVAALLSVMMLFLLAFSQAFCQETQHIVMHPDKFSAIIPPDSAPCLVYDGIREKPGLVFTEGPSWINGRLYFSNIHYRGSRGIQGLQMLNPDGTLTILNNEVQTEGSSPLPNGNFAICDMRGNRIIEMTTEGEVVRTIANRCDGRPFGTPNDLITDTKGGIYFTQPEGYSLPGSAVYYIKPDGNVIRVTGWDEFETPNGCMMSPDGSLFYLGDFSKQWIWEFDVNDDGTLSNKRKFGEIILGDEQQGVGKKLSPFVDGMTLDTGGNMYLATRAGIQIIDPTGLLLGVAVFPKRVVHCVFGGDDLSTLYALCVDQIYTLRTGTKGFQYPIMEE